MLELNAPIMLHATWVRGDPTRICTKGCTVVKDIAAMPSSATWSSPSRSPCRTSTRRITSPLNATKFHAMRGQRTRDLGPRGGVSRRSE